MKIRVTRRFIDRANMNATREKGEEYEAPDDRAAFLIRLGLAEAVPEPEAKPESEETAEAEESAETDDSEKHEAVEAPESKAEDEGGETPVAKEKSAKRTRKAAK